MLQLSVKVRSTRYTSPQWCITTPPPPLDSWTDGTLSWLSSQSVPVIMSGVLAAALSLALLLVVAVKPGQSSRFENTVR